MTKTRHNDQCGLSAQSSGPPATATCVICAVICLTCVICAVIYLTYVICAVIYLTCVSCTVKNCRDIY